MVLNVWHEKRQHSDTQIFQKLVIKTSFKQFSIHSLTFSTQWIKLDNYDTGTIDLNDFGRISWKYLWMTSSKSTNFSFKSTQRNRELPSILEYFWTWVFFSKEKLIQYLFFFNIAFGEKLDMVPLGIPQFMG